MNYCGSCGARVQAGARFCTACGASVAGSVSAPVAGPVSGPVTGPLPPPIVAVGAAAPVAELPPLRAAKHTNSAALMVGFAAVAVASGGVTVLLLR